MEDKIAVIMTTIPEREAACLQAMSSLINQADCFRIIFNGFQEVPNFSLTAQVPDKKIHCVCLPQDTHKANAVWSWLSVFYGCEYIFIVDDDILYPPDYIKKMVHALKYYKNQAVLTVHGKWWEDGKFCLAHFKHQLNSDMFVSIAGVGTCAFHKSILREPFVPAFSYFRDLQFSLWCAKNCIPICAIQRPLKWLTPIPTEGRSLCDIVMADEELKRKRDSLIRGIHEYTNSIHAVSTSG
jgi:hypothetical protein